MDYNKTIFTETYKVRSTQVNLNNQLGLYGLLGMLQDIAAEHAAYLGFGYKQLVQKGFFWALIQQKLKMKAVLSDRFALLHRLYSHHRGGGTA